MLKALISPFMLVIAGILVYANSLSNPFIYDDQVAIVDNVDIRQLWPPSWVSPTTLEHAPTNSRPVVSFTLALNYAFGTLDVRGFRAFNIAVHILCSFAIYLVLNQTFSKNRDRLTSSQKKTLEKPVTYFENHRHMMHYDVYLNKATPLLRGWSKAPAARWLKTAWNNRACAGPSTERRRS